MRHEETTRTDGQYNVTLYLSDNGKAVVSKAKVEFRCDSEDYGNGYYMGVRSDLEPFGFSAYDIRYDREFDPARKIPYIVQFYANRFTGHGGSWELTGINVHEAEFEEL